MENNDLLDDDFEGGEIEDQSDSAEKVTGTINIDARRRLEDYRDKRELERLLKDDFDYLDDIA